MRQATLKPTTDGPSIEARAVGLCALRVDPSGIGVDLKSVDELLRATFDLTEEETDEWFAAAVFEGFIDMGPERAVN